MRVINLILILPLLFGCNLDSKFNSEKWKTNSLDWQLSDVRQKMVSDIIGSDTLIGLDEQQVYELLGEPSFKKANQVQYLVREKYMFNIDPEYIEYLNVDFSDNHKVTKCYLVTFD